MKKIKTWLRKDDHDKQLLKMICAFLFPIIVCALQCLHLGGRLGDVYLPNSQNNDDLFYFKQIEAIIEYGIPQGFFGFNESQAANLSFASWSPLTLFVGAIWGKIFGWTLSSYYWCNIMFHSVVLAFFTYQAKPKFKQMIAAGLLIGLFPGFAKYTLSCLVETHMISYMLLFYALALGYIRQPKKWKIAGMFAVGVFLTCIRPYLVLLIVLPGIFVFMKKKWAGILLSGGIGAVSVVGYFAISKYLTAAYLTPLFDKTMFTRFVDEGVISGIRHIVSAGLYFFKILLEDMKQSFLTGKFMGSNYCVLFLLCILLFGIFIKLYRRRKKDDRKLYAIVYGHYIATALISVVALLALMNKINEGSRHIIPFIIVGFILISFMKNWTKAWRPALVALFILFLFYYYPDDGQDYQIPLRTQERYEEQQTWNELIKDIELSEYAPSYENTVIWTFSDRVDGNVCHMDWQPILAMPAGMGISCCQVEYIENNWDTLQSRYIITDDGGQVSSMCEDAGYEIIAEYDGTILYQRY